MFHYASQVDNASALPSPRFEMLSSMTLRRDKLTASAPAFSQADFSIVSLSGEGATDHALLNPEVQTRSGQGS
jgi:hypothetical protein